MNRAFDRASIGFFSGQYGQVIRDLHALTGDLESPGSPPGSSARLARSLKATLVPPIAVAGPRLDIRVDCAPMYALDAPAGRPTILARLDPAAGPGAQAEHPWDPAAQVQSLTLALDHAAPGSWRLRIAIRDGAEQSPWVDAGQVCVLARPLEDERRALAARLESLARSDAIAPARATARARLDLLADDAGAASSARFLADTHELLASVTAEVVALESGVNPYAGRAGDHWRVVSIDAATMPVRVFAPDRSDPRPDAPDEPLPLLIALHGAGGDENMFFEGYGAGAIKDLARQRRVLVAAPLTYTIMGSPAMFDRLVEDLARDYPVDRARVYVIGHSLGGGAASGLARLRASALAAVCCIAGGSFPAVGKGGDPIPFAPTLVIGGALDPIVPAARLRAGAERARAAGLRVEYREKKDFGHTLLVGATLAEAIDWLLARKLEGEVRPTP